MVILWTELKSRITVISSLDMLYIYRTGWKSGRGGGACSHGYCRPLTESPRPEVAAESRISECPTLPTSYSSNQAYVSSNWIGLLDHHDLAEP